MIAELNLQPLPAEGGYFRQTWLSETCGPDGRATASEILFLMTAEGFSALHRVDADETWRFLAGDPVEHLQLDPRDGTARTVVLGEERVREVRVPAGVWQGARLEGGGPAKGWALCRCTMTPGWDEQGFELGFRAELLRGFPAQAADIVALTR